MDGPGRDRDRTGPSDERSGAGAPAELAGGRRRRAGAVGRRRPHPGAARRAGAGAVDDPGSAEVRVEVRHDPSAGGTWSQGLSGLLNWLAAAGRRRSGRRAGRRSGRRARTAGRGGRAGRRDQLVRDRAAAGRALPAGAAAAGRAAGHHGRAPRPGHGWPRGPGAGDVRVTGTAGWAAVRTGSGDSHGGRGRRRRRRDHRLRRHRARTDQPAGPGCAPGRARCAWPGPADPPRSRPSSGDVTVRRGGRRPGRAHRLRRGHRGRRPRGAAGADHRFRRSCGSACTPGWAPSWTCRPARDGPAANWRCGRSAPAEPPALQVRGRTGSGDVLVTRAAVPA